MNTLKTELASNIFTVKKTPELWESNIGEKKYFMGKSKWPKSKAGMMPLKPNLTARERCGEPVIIG
jgi:hypothetical protein